MTRTALALRAVLFFSFLASGCSDNNNEPLNDSSPMLQTKDASTNTEKIDAQTGTSTNGDASLTPAMPEVVCSSAPKNKAVCVPGTDVNCYVKCGPEKIGKRPCVCNPTTSVWECIPCLWDSSKDYSCYKIPATPPTCGGGVLPQNGDACKDNPCSTCSSYVDSNRTTREGYCVCANGMYSCATSGEWPCLDGKNKGCL